MTDASSAPISGESRISLQHFFISWQSIMLQYKFYNTKFRVCTYCDLYSSWKVPEKILRRGTPAIFLASQLTIFLESRVFTLSSMLLFSSIPELYNLILWKPPRNHSRTWRRYPKCSLSVWLKMMTSPKQQSQNLKFTIVFCIKPAVLTRERAGD